MAKENNSRFNLDKSSDRKFDLSKGGKRKFDLSKDDDEPIVTPSAPAPTPTASTTQSVATEGKSANTKKWPLIIAALAVAGALAWWLIPSSSTPESEVSTNTPVEEVVATETEVTTEQSPADESAVETPAPESTEATTASKEPAEAPASASAVETPAPTAPVSGNIEAEALKVIRGEYGVGKERMSKLGDQYSAIQARVNQLKRQGAF